MELSPARVLEKRIGRTILQKESSRKQPALPAPFPCVPDRPYKILLAQVGTLSFLPPFFGVSVLFIYLFIVG